ncbi:MAG: sigma 54-interacting transcriptional regulator [Desulfamplus sp.]|nr:sigma 54-interacting transcriptional regulator [Desulfamplus sp.]
MAEFILDQKNLELVLDNLRDGIIAHDINRKIMFFNRAAEHITGYSKDEVIGHDCHDIFGSPFCGEHCSFCNTIIDNKEFNDSQTFKATKYSKSNKTEIYKTKLNKCLEYPITIITKDGELRKVEMCITAIIDKNNLKGVIASFRDITYHEALALKAQELTSFSGIVGKDKEMINLFDQIRDVASYDYPVHIHGETGTGKERVAYALHNESRRAGALFVPVNCGAIPEGLVESELFGHVKGAFSGAVKDRKGRFELAHKGTLFLDEVAELPKQIQVKLLRFLQEGVLERVGGEKSIQVDVRIISATNKELGKEVEEGNFRKDLYYRLNVIPIELPPLRKRRNDIPLLIDHFLEMAKNDNKINNGSVIPRFSKDAIRLMMDYSWPGNVRELQNAVQFAIVRCKQNQVMPSDLPMELRNIGQSRPKEVEIISDKDIVSTKNEDNKNEDKYLGKLNKDSVKKALEITGGNKAKAARYLRVGRATLYRFLDRFPEASDIEAYLH